MSQLPGQLPDPRTSQPSARPKLAQPGKASKPMRAEKGQGQMAPHVNLAVPHAGASDDAQDDSDYDSEDESKDQDAEAQRRWARMRWDSRQICNAYIGVRRQSKMQQGRAKAFSGCLNCELLVPLRIPRDSHNASGRHTVA